MKGEVGILWEPHGIALLFEVRRCGEPVATVCAETTPETLTVIFKDEDNGEALIMSLPSTSARA
jgi:hypothetical protein